MADLEIGDFIKVTKEPEYDFWNNTYEAPDDSNLPVFKVHQISHNFKKQSYRLALEDIKKPGHVDYHVVPASRVKILPVTRDGEPYASVLRGN